MGVRIVFLGSATFALPSLDALFEAGYTISAVITQPDKPTGRGHALHGPPIKTRAHELHLPIYQPNSLKTDESRVLLETLNAELIVVVAYGKILPRWLLQLPKYGCVNLHGSLLPKYRGAAPVHWAIANGEEKTGVCTMLLDEGLDTGPVYVCEETTIGPDETVAVLYDRLALIGAPLIVRTVEGIVGGTLEPKPQDGSQATLAPILKKEDGVLDWRWPAQKIHNRVRAFNPWPGTVTRFRGQTCKILKTVVGAGPPSASATASSIKDDRALSHDVEVVGGHRPSQLEPGSLIASKRNLSVVCGDGVALEILSIQPENRKAISGADFANGARIQAGEKFEPLVDN